LDPLITFGTLPLLYGMHIWEVDPIYYINCGLAGGGMGKQKGSLPSLESTPTY
jgi:hypothetical protein